MTVDEFLRDATYQLEHAGIETARLDVLVLLEEALGQNRANLLAHSEQEISKTTEVELNKKIAQRAKHTPLAYILGSAEFYGRKFAVNPQVLVPRPETEAMITLTLEALKVLGSRFEDLDEPVCVVDVGTGSGAIAITMKLERPELEVHAIDISPKTLDLAQKNAQKHDAKVQFLCNDLLDPLAADRYQLPAIIMANLPYVPDDHPINQAAKHEPKLALFAGKDGLDIYRRFWRQISKLGSKPEHVITESLPQQHRNMSVLAKKSGYRLQKTNGFAQLFTLEPKSPGT